MMIARSRNSITAKNVTNKSFGLNSCDEGSGRVLCFIVVVSSFVGTVVSISCNKVVLVVVISRVVVAGGIVLVLVKDVLELVLVVDSSSEGMDTLKSRSTIPPASHSAVWSALIPSI